MDNSEGYYIQSFKILKKNKLAIICIFVVISLIIISVFAEVIAPYDPNKQNLAERLIAPGLTHIFGTDEFGRDILSRCIYGCRISLSVGIISQIIATIIGYALGVSAGYFGRKVDMIISFFIQVFSSIPFLLFSMALMFVLGHGIINLYISLGVLSWANTAKLIRAKVLQLKNQEYIFSSRLDGASNLHIILKHLLPNCIPTLIITITLGIPSAILSEASLSFLGLGVQSPTASWGAMIASSQTYIRTNTYYSIFPGLCIIITVMAFHIIGDGLRDALDPKMRK